MEYKKTYGRRDIQPDKSKCAANVTSASIWDGGSQCTRKAICDPDKDGNPTTCKQHSQEASKARKDKRDAEYARQSREWAFKRNGERFYDALKLIAEGHNDPRSLAQDVISKSDIE